MKKIAIILSGCGHKDGAEITETVSLIIALSSLQVQMGFFAPMELDYETKHPLSDEPLPLEKRNCLLESARITRGDIRDLKELDVKDWDALCLPGGNGVALNLSNWASKGARCEVHPHLEATIKAFHQGSKPIGAMCIAPAIVARVLGHHKITVTIGNDPQVSKEIKKTGAHHEDCPVDDYLSDREGKIVSTPAYMYNEAKAYEIFKGIQGLAQELVEWA